MSTWNDAINNKWVKISLISFLITILAFILSPSRLNAIVYQSYIYPNIRTALNVTFGSLLFPAFYIILASLILSFIFIPALQLLRRKYIHALVYTLSYALFLITVFFWLWGFHYNNPILVPQPKLEEYPMTKDRLLKTMHTASMLRSQLSKDSISPIWDSQVVQIVEDSGQVWLNLAVELLGDQPTSSSKNVRWWPKGSLLRWGVVGMYFPFTGEATVDKGLHAVRFPITVLHEWAHSMGYTNEGDCNLIAYLASQYSHHAFVRYSAEIERLREELYFTAMQNYDLYEEVKSILPPMIEKDLVDMRNYHAQYRGKTSEIGTWINDQYLKTFSSENGIDDYWLWVIKLHLIEIKPQQSNSVQTIN